MIQNKNAYQIAVVEDNLGDFVLVEEYICENAPQSQLKHFPDYESFNHFMQHPEVDFDLIFLDLSLPDINKDNLIEAVSDVSDQTPIVILTGYSDINFAAKSLSVGITDYLLKDTLSPLILNKSIIYALERHRYIQSLRVSEKKYMELFDLSPAPILVYNLSSLKIIDANIAAIKHYGYAKDEFLDMRFKELFAKDFSFKLFKKAKFIEKNIDKNLVQHTKKNGQVIDVEIISNRINYNGIVAEIVVITDVTEKRKHLQAIKIQNKKLKDIAWNQSHIVRAPVARLLGMVDLLQTNSINNEEQNKLLQSIYDSSMEIDKIIEDTVLKSKSIFDTDER